MVGFGIRFLDSAWCGRERARILAQVLVALLLLGPLWLEAQNQDAAFQERSAAIRTALHYDPSLPGQVEELIRLYEKEGRLSELLAIYENHTAQYPDDRSANCVLLRLYLERGDEAAGPRARDLVQRFPDDPYVLELAYETLREISFLVKAVEVEVDRDTQVDRFERLLGEVAGAEERAQAGGLFGQIAGRLRPGDAVWPDLATAGLREGLFEQTGAWLQSWEGGMGPGEGELDRLLFLVRADEGRGKTDLAEEGLRRALNSMHADHERRASVLGDLFRLLRAAGREEEEVKRLREEITAAPDRPGPVLDLAVLLRGNGKRGEALALIREASLRLPEDRRLEKEVLELLPDEEKTAYLMGKLQAGGERADLLLRLVERHFRTGANELAMEAWATLENVLPADVRQEERLRLGRLLASEERWEEAQPFLEAALREEPKRVSVRWELASLKEKSGDPPGAADLLRGLETADLEREQALVHADELIRRQMWSEADRWLGDLEQQMPGDAEVAAKKLNVLGARGDWERGVRFLESWRGKSLEEGAFAHWLENAASFYEGFGRERQFFREEQTRLRDGGDSESDVSQLLALCDVAQELGARDGVISWLRNRFERGGLELGEEEAIRRKLVEVLGEDAAHGLETEVHLRWLLENGNPPREEDRIRLATLYATGNRPDLAGSVLKEIDPEGLVDSAWLGKGAELSRSLGFDSLAARLFQRWTVVAASQREPWEERWAFLKERKEEEGYRNALDDFLSAEPGSEAEGLSRERANQNWAESALRSMLRSWSGGDWGRAEELLTLAKRRPSLEGEDWLAWMECLIRGETRWDPDRVAGGWISFPGDWELNAREAERVLRKAEQVWTGTGGGGQPMLRQPELRWKFRAEEGKALIRAAHSDGWLVFYDSSRTVYALDGRSGKLKWRRGPEEWMNRGQTPPGYLHREGKIPLLLQSGDQLLKITSNGRIVTAPSATEATVLSPLPHLSVHSGRVLLTDGQGLVALDAETGLTSWRLSLAEEGEQNERANRIRLFVSEGRQGLFAFDSRTGTLVRIDPQTGKLRWKVQSGANFSFAVFGRNAVVLMGRADEKRQWQVHSLEDGNVIWTGSDELDEGRTDGVIRESGGVIAFYAGAKVELRLELLPLCRTEVEVDGTFVGEAGSKLAFWDGRRVALIDGLSGTVERLPPPAEPIQSVFLENDKLTVVGATQISWWNPFTARPLKARAWSGVDPGDWGSNLAEWDPVKTWTRNAVRSKKWTLWGPEEKSVRVTGGHTGDICWTVTEEGVAMAWGEGDEGANPKRDGRHEDGE